MKMSKYTLNIGCTQGDLNRSHKFLAFVSVVNKTSFKLSKGRPRLELDKYTHTNKMKGKQRDKKGHVTGIRCS